MPDIRYQIGHYWYCEKGAAINHCIKYNISIDSIIKKEFETVAEYEKRTGKNYGCAPCMLLANGDCNGDKPGSFYYPHECPEFTTGEEYEDEYDPSDLEYWEDDIY